MGCWGLQVAKARAGEALQMPLAHCLWDLQEMPGSGLVAKKGKIGRESEAGEHQTAGGPACPLCYTGSCQLRHRLRTLMARSGHAWSRGLGREVGL